MPGIVNARELTPLGGGGGIGDDTAAVLPGSKLSNRFFYTYVDTLHVWDQPSNQPGWLEQM